MTTHGAPDSSASSALSRPVLSRRLAYIMLVRVILLTLILGGIVGINLSWGTPEALAGPFVTFLFIFIAAIYLLSILYAVLLRTLPHLGALAVAQLSVDLLTAAVLVHVTGGADSGLVLLFLLAPIAAALTFRRRVAILTAGAGALVLALVVLGGYHGLLPPIPGQEQLPAAVSPGAVVRSLIVNSTAMVAVALLAGYLSEQLRTATRHMEVQQAHIDDLSALNADIIRSLTSGLITVSEQGRVLTINQAAGTILGVGPHTATGRPLATLAPELAEATDRAPEVRRSEVALAGGGHSKLLGVSVSPLSDHMNRVRGRVINFQDLTSIREMEVQFKRSEHLASLGRMAAGIAHEIRNPLASISGSLELLRSTLDLGDDDRKLMEIALREIDHLNGLIEDFLAYARPRPSQIEPLDLGSEILEMAGSIASLGAEELPALRVAQTEPGLWVRADRDQLRGILWNLLRNAWEAGEQEEVQLRVRGLGEDQVLLQVSDRGAGISEADLQHVFEPFFTTKESGTGLGLATVHRIVQDHGGKITAASEEGTGTHFSITLPRVPPEAG